MVEGQISLPPLAVKCSQTDCDRNLHCFRATRKMSRNNTAGRCRECGKALVDWTRVHKRDLSDVMHTFEALRLEFIRHHFWHVDINVRAQNYARRKGRVGLQLAVEKRILGSLGDASPYRDGRQTPMASSPNPIHHAQHATASCCRKCVEEWHGIPQGRALGDPEVEYLARLAMMYIQERIPDLTEVGVKVPPLRG